MITNKAIQIRNEMFRQLTPQQKRVQIAKDVLKYIAAGRLLATSGTYLDFSTSNCDVTSTQKTLLKQEECEVCAKGALFYAKVANYNDYELVLGNADYFSVSNDQVTEALEDIFDVEQLNLIEAAFERDATYAEDSSGLFLAESARNIYYDYSDPDSRLELIMNNIISNNGEFVVDLAVEEYDEYEE